jgi:hypothetical protein
LNVAGEIIKASPCSIVNMGAFHSRAAVLCANEQTIEPAARKVAT